MASVSSTSTTASLISASTSTSTTSSTSSTTDTSEIDWDGLIEEAVAAKLSKADSIDLKITSNEAKAAAYESAADLLTTMLEAANALRSPSGTEGSSDDVFNGRAAYLTANGDVDASATLAATVDSGTTTGSHELTVTQLAKAHKVTSGSVSTNYTDLGYEGTISLGTSAGGSADIEITTDMSLAEIAEAINATSGTTGVKASVLNVSSSGYQLVLSGSATGTTVTASGDVLETLGVIDEEGSFADELQAAQSAIFSVDGIEITSTTNDIEDVIDGVTLHIYQTTSDGSSITLEVGTDLSAVKDAIVALVDAYNAYRDYAYANQQPPTDDNADTTVLFGDSTLRNINSAVADALNTRIDSNALSLLGLTFDAYNNLELDEDVLDAALLSDLDDIEALLSFQMESSSSSLMLLQRGTSVPADFSMDIVTDSSGAITSVSVGGDSSLFTVSGTRIIGATGTAYEGFTFVYAGSSSTSVDVSFSTGIAELLYNVAEKATNNSKGTLTNLVSELEDTNTTLDAKSDDIRERAETYRTNLTNRYANYQAAIETANSMLDYLETLLDTWNSTS